MTTKYQSPKWVIIYLWIATGMAAMFSLLAYAKPDIQFGAWAALSATGALSLAGPLGLYLSRNLATVAVGLFALTNKSLDALKMLLLLRILTDGIDFIHNLVSGDMQGGTFALAMCIIEVAGIWAVKNKASQ